MTLLLFWGIGGYSNYTSPISFKENVELVVSHRQSFVKVISFENTCNETPCFITTTLSSIAKRHQTFASIMYKKFDPTISLEIKHHLLLFHTPTYSSEEESLFV